MNIPTFRFLNQRVLSFHAAALILGLAALASKILGLFRDRLLAAHFGAGDALDAYYAAFQIPDLLFTIFLVGAASAAVLPIFLARERKSEREAEAFLGNLLTVFSVVACIAIGGAIAAAPWLMKFVAPGFGPEKFASAVALTRWMLGGTLFFGIAGILTTALQARHRFFAVALPPIVYNIGIIFGIIVFVPFFGAVGLAYGVLLGAVLQVCVSASALAETGFHFRFSFLFADAGLHTVARISVPRVLALGMSQITILILGAIASYFASGSVSVFKFATNLVYVPVGLIGVSYALAMFPKLSDASLAGEGEVFREHVRLGIRNILFWTAPVVTITIVLRAHLVRVILGSGAFNWEDTRLVAASLGLLAIAIASESLLPLILRAFYALGDTKSPLLWDIIGSLATILFSLGFALWFLHSPSVLSTIARIMRIGDLASPRILAIAIGFMLGSVTNLLLLVFVLGRVMERRLHIRMEQSLKDFLIVAGAALFAGFAAYFSLMPFPALVPTNTFFGIFLQGLIAGVVGFGVYALVLLGVKNQEARAVYQVFKEHLFSFARTPEVYETEKLDGESMK